MDKLKLSTDVINIWKVKTKEEVESIADCILNNRFIFEYRDDHLVKFLSWEVHSIRGTQYVFFNNLLIDRDNRDKKFLLSLRKLFRGKNVKFWWRNRKREKFIERV